MIAFTTTHFSALATPRGANECFERDWRAGRWPVALPLPRVRAVRRLRLHPGSRCTFLYSVAGWPVAECIVKVYARPRLPAAHAVAPLLLAGFAAAGRHRVPAVIAELPALHLVMAHVAPGASAAELLCGGDLAAAARAGEWLGAFQAAPVALPAAYALHDPLAQAARWNARLARHLPDLADRAGALHAWLLRERPPWPASARLIHGDFGATHVVVAAATTTVIDWDGCRAGDAAEDAGRFIASLWHLAARGHITGGDASVAERHFRAAYGATQPEAAARLPFYAALACLHRASQIARHGARRRWQAAALLAAGLAELEGNR